MYLCAPWTSTDHEMTEVEVAGLRLLKSVASSPAACQSVAVSCHLHPQHPSLNSRPKPLPCTLGRKLRLANAVKLIRLGSKFSTVDVFGTCGSESDGRDLRAQGDALSVLCLSMTRLWAGPSALMVDIGGRTDIRGGFASSPSQFGQ